MVNRQRYIHLIPGFTARLTECTRYNANDAMPTWIYEMRGDTDKIHNRKSATLARAFCGQQDVQMLAHLGILPSGGCLGTRQCL
jgi:hypothetical protein